MSDLNEETQQDEASTSPDIQEISWQASEYIHNEKHSTWYIAFGLGLAVLLVIIYLILRDWLSVAVIGLGGVAALVYANRPPRTISYSLDDKSITIDDRHYEYDSFRSFSLSEEQAISHIVLNPIERFMPAITMYVDPNQIDQIVDTLGAFIPYAEHRPDAIDRLARKIRF